MKKRLERRCLPMNIAIFLRTPILKNIFKRQLLQWESWSNLGNLIKPLKYFLQPKLFQNISQHSKDSNHDRVLFNWICGLWSWHFTAFSGDFLCEFSQIFLEKLFFGTNPDESSIPIPRWSIQEQPPEVFYKKGALKNFTKSTGKHLCQSLFFNKVAVLRPATLLKKDSGAGVFLSILWNF